MNKRNQSILSLGILSAALLTPAIAAAYSHSVNLSKSYEINPGSTFLNAGLTIGATNTETASSSAAKVETVQSNSTWVKLSGKSYTTASLSSSGTGSAAWSSGNNPQFTASAKATVTLFGNTVLSQSTASSCKNWCPIDKANSVTKDITPTVALWGFSVYGVNFGVTGKLAGSAGYGIDAMGGANPISGGSQYDAVAQNGGTGSTNLVVSFGASIGIVSANVSANVDVFKASAAPYIANEIQYFAPKNMNVAWNNTAPLSVSSAGGKVEAKACYNVLLDSGCASKTLFSWNGFSKSTTLYNSTGGLTNQTAF